jgi:ABC-type Zn uptake system ZnuABC Zn-binding protein ZnuA
MSTVQEELHEHAEHAKHPFDKKVAATMAAVAAALAIVAVLGHLAATEELLNQQKASDQWAYYQAKNIRRYESEIARDFMIAMKADQKADAYAKNADRYDKETKEIQKEAKALEDESHLAGRKALRFHFGEIFLEIAIVLASLAILTKREAIWIAAVVGALMGILTAASMFLVK